MKKINVIYVGFVIIFLIIIYFTTLSSVIIDSQNALNKEIFDTAKQTNDFDDFVAYQTKEYQKIVVNNEKGYSFHVYQYIDATSEANGLLVIINPIAVEKFATDADDLADKTRLVITANDTIVLDTNAYGKAISAGYSNTVVGFIFFNAEIKQNSQVRITYHDYDNINIAEFSLEYNIKTNADTFNKGYTLEAIKERMNLTAKITKRMILVITIYLVVAIMMPFLYRVVKHLVLNRSRK